MIEIRAEEGAPVARTDGGHDPEQTRAIADGIREAVRLLNYATMEAGGVRYPSVVYDVLGALAAAAGAMPQALMQMSAWVAGQVQEGTVREVGGDAAASAYALAGITQEAAAAAARLQRLLDQAQSATRDLSVRTADEGEGTTSA